MEYSGLPRIREGIELSKRVGFAFVFALLLSMIVASPAFAKPYSEPTVDVSDSNPKPGEPVTVSGDNWCPGSTVSIYLDGQFVGTATVDAGGHFDTSIVIPKDIDPGQHTITVVGLDSSCTEVVTRTTVFNIAGGGVSGQATLPFTGSNISVGVLLLAALVIVGTTALVAGRRRKAAHEA